MRAQEIFNAVVSGLGILANIVNVFIWSKQVRKSSVSYLLVGLSTSDLLSVTWHFIFLVWIFFKEKAEKCSKKELQLTVAIFHVFILFSNISAWITVAIGFVRYAKVAYPFYGNSCNSRRIAKMILIIVFVSVPIVSFPTYLFYEVREKTNNGSNQSVFGILYSSDRITGSDAYREVVLWIYGCLVKLLACALVIFTTTRIIYILKSRPLTSMYSIEVKMGNRRTTHMLAVMLLMFFILETPIGITSIYYALKTEDHHYFFFLSNETVGVAIDTCALLNCSLNIFIYVGISTKFRKTLFSLLGRRR